MVGATNFSTSALSLGKLSGKRRACLKLSIIGMRSTIEILKISCGTTAITRLTC